jgi:nucleoside-diphosphate-sugar epimerase
MNLLIIGGSGHVSGTLARTALAGGHHVWTITRGKRPVPGGAKSLVVDRHDHKAMASVIAGENRVWDLVVDCICYDVPDIQQDIDLFRNRARQFVFVSTDFVYNPAQRTFPQPEETDHYAQMDKGSKSYGLKKRLCEQALMDADTGDMAWTIVRPCHIYGPGSELGCLPLHGRDPDLIRKMQTGEALQLVGAGHFLQQPILVHDLAATIISIAGCDTVGREIFNIAGPDMIESWQYYQIIADVLAVDLQIEEIPVQSYAEQNPDKAPFLCHRIYNLNRLQVSDLNVPSTSIEEGLRLHVEALSV